MNYLNIIAIVSSSLGLISAICVDLMAHKIIKATRSMKKAHLNLNNENLIQTIIITKDGKKFEYTLMPDTKLETLMTDETQKIEIINKNNLSTNTPEAPMPVNS